ncbi:MAG: 2-oxoacid:acceptor oxidoreductase family protein [Desulfurococcaceae archaeon]
MIEIIFYGRGGQGGVTAANLLVEAAMYEGLYGQAFPFFGAERRGAPVLSFARISDRPILRHGMFTRADVVAVLDDSLLTCECPRVVVKDGGTVIINTQREDVVVKTVSLEGRAKAYAVDASGIALKEGLVIAGWPVVNTAMLGALARATGIVSVSSLVKAVRENYGGRLGELNVRALLSAYEGLRELRL